MSQLWLSKQCIGICATRGNLARIQDIRDDRFPNCDQGRETSTHLNCCPDHERTMLFKEGVAKLSTWMCQNNHTDPELAYWIEKYLLFRGTRSFASLVVEGGFGSLDVRVAAAGQDLIGWTEFLHGKVSVEIASIQQLHCMSSPSCRLTGNDWMKAFIFIYFRYLIPSGFSATTLFTTSNGDICVCACASTSSARYTSCWRPLHPMSHWKISIYWNSTTPPCTMQDTRNRPTGSWH
jgi:hypothetical protein